MRLLQVIGIAFFAATTVWSQEIPTNIQGKGTIGLYCTDTAGAVHFWNPQMSGPFDSCLDSVVQAWTSKNASTQPAPPPSQGSDASAAAPVDELIQGMTAYHQSVDRVNALREVRH